MVLAVDKRTAVLTNSHPLDAVILERDQLARTVHHERRSKLGQHFAIALNRCVEREVAGLKIDSDHIVQRWCQWHCDCDSAPTGITHNEIASNRRVVSRFLRHGQATATAASAVSRRRVAPDSRTNGRVKAGELLVECHIDPSRANAVAVVGIVTDAGVSCRGQVVFQLAGCPARDQRNATVCRNVCFQTAAFVRQRARRNLTGRDTVAGQCNRPVHILHRQDSCRRRGQSVNFQPDDFRRIGRAFRDASRVNHRQRGATAARSIDIRLHALLCRHFRCRVAGHVVFVDHPAVATGVGRFNSDQCCVAEDRIDLGERVNVFRFQSRQPCDHAVDVSLDALLCRYFRGQIAGHVILIHHEPVAAGVGRGGPDDRVISDNRIEFCECVNVGSRQVRAEIADLRLCDRQPGQKRRVCNFLIDR